MWLENESMRSEASAGWRLQVCATMVGLTAHWVSAQPAERSDASQGLRVGVRGAAMFGPADPTNDMFP